MLTLRKFGFLLCISFFTSVFALGQSKFSGDPGTFPTEVNAMMALTKNQDCIDAGSKFGSVWGTFSAAQQKKTIEVSQKLVKSKRLKINPHFRDFYLILTDMQAKGMSGSQLDTFLIIVDKVSETYQTAQMEFFFKTSRLIIEEGYLYKSSYNTLRMQGGTFAFHYKEAPAEQALPDEVPPDTTTQKNLFNDWDNNQTEDTWSTLEDTNATASQASALDVGYTPPVQPTIEGAIITITGATFVLSTPNDSVEIKNTSGSIILKTGVYVGKGGTFDWSSVDLPEVYCDLAEYNFPIKSYKIISEGSRLHYPSQTDSIPLGVFEFNSVKARSENDKNYPRFKSFYSNIPVKGLDENIRYHGGFSMSGRKIFSSSLDEGYSRIEILKDNEVKIRAVSNRFQLGDSLITSDYTKLIIYNGEDSIYHPGTIFKFNKNSHFLRVAKTNGYRMAPFIDSYHKLEITSDALSWNLNEDKIDFYILNARNEVPALFESEEFFALNKYAQLKGLYQFHPLQMLVGYADKQHTDEFPVGDLAQSTKIPENTLRGAMIQLMKLGFIDYNINSGLIKVKPKARHYVLSRRDKKDYDNINFVSISPAGANAELNLTTNSLIVRGVKRVYISDSLNVNIEPDSSQIEILANRDFKFNGKINTANFQFIGTDFRFDYDSFLVKMPSINAIKLAVTTDSTKEKEGHTKVLGNELRYSSGTLYINKPDNKSARKRMPEYPIFDATTGASVYFNKSQIANGAYDTTIKFKIPPFKVDSLSNDDPSVIGFDGTFESGGIFPDFKERLVVMPDYALGFIHKVPQDGYQMYGGDGKFYSTLKLDNQGLRGKGEIHFLNTTLWSNDFVYFKDSTLTDGTKMVTKAGTNPLLPPTVTFPDVSIDAYRLHWKPKLDSMYISNIEKPLELYNKTAGLQGTVIVTHGGMYGLGILTTRGSETESPLFHFEEKRFGAHKAIFRIKSDNPSKPALKATDAKVEFDLEKGIATFGPEQQGFASTEFPYAQYKTSIEKGVWDLDKRKVFLTAADTLNIASSYFYSTHPQQDSLVFNASKAEYLIDSLTLNVFGVPYIHVNDGKIFPEKNKVLIRENAVMQTLNNAKIEMDTINKYHHLYDGNIDIYGRKSFNGEAIYQYVNLGSDTLQIKFSNFQYTPSEKKKGHGYTIAIAQVMEDDTLYVGDRILYKGNITMKSPDKFLAFDGYIKLDMKGELSYSSWLKYVNTGQSSTVSLDLKSAMSERGKALVTSLSFDNRTNQLYPNFISEKIHADDKDLLPVPDGVFQYNPDSLEFCVGNAEKLKGTSYKGNYFNYNDNLSTIKYGGRFYIGQEGSSNVKIFSSGNGRGNLLEDSYQFDYLLGFIFKVNATPITAMATNISVMSQSIQTNNTSSSGDIFSPTSSTNNSDVELYQKLAEFIDNSGVDNYKSLKSSGTVSLASLNSDFAKAFLFTDVNMKWSPEYKAFYSLGDVTLSNILKTNINKPMKGYIEIKKTTKGDAITIYLEPVYNTWYFITYDDNRLAMASSVDDVNRAIASKTKGEMPDRSKFFVVKAEPMEVNKFVNGYEERYGIISDDPVQEDSITSDSLQLDSLQIHSDSLLHDSTSTHRKNLHLNDTDNSQQRLQQGGQNNNYQDTKSNPDQYKLQEQNTTYETDPNANKNTPNKSTVEQQQQLQQDQQQLKNLFK